MLSILLSRRARKKELSQDNEEQPAAHRPRRIVVFVALSVVLLSMVSIVVNERIASTSLGKLGGTSHVDSSVAARPSRTKFWAKLRPRTKNFGSEVRVFYVRPWC
jgi:hypothetical protein